MFNNTNEGFNLRFRYIGNSEFTNELNRMAVLYNWAGYLKFILAV